MTVNDRASRERYVALQAWLCGQMSPRAPHATRCFEEDPQCLYDAFLSVLVGTGLGFADHDDNRAHHGLYAFDFFVGDIKAPPRGRGVDGQSEPGMAGESTTDAAARAMCHALVDAWLGDVGRHIPFVASVIASVATLELVARVRVDECIFELDLPPDYASATANRPWEDGSLPIGALDQSLVVPGPPIHVRACAPHERKGLADSGFAEALAASTQMGMRVESAGSDAAGVHALLRGPNDRPEALGWAADAVARALSARGYAGGVRIWVRREGEAE